MPCGHLDSSWEQGGRMGGSSTTKGPVEQAGLDGQQADQEGHGRQHAEPGRIGYGAYGRVGRGGGNTGKDL